MGSARAAFKGSYKGPTRFRVVSLRVPFSCRGGRKFHKGSLRVPLRGPKFCKGSITQA